jgi:hypothetical protein
VAADHWRLVDERFDESGHFGLVRIVKQADLPSLMLDANMKTYAGQLCSVE